MLLSWVSKYDGRGTAAARKDFARLGKSAVSTQLTVGALTYAFGRLAQASIQAAMAEQQSLTQVNKALENAGFANATTQVDEFIVSLQNATGIVKKELRPAFLTLFNATGDVGASQESLQKALDIVAGTGKDLSTVVTALSRAYAGNRESLNELNTGLDKTMLKTGSLVEIMDELDRKFKGQAAAASATLTAQFLQLQLGIDKVTQAFGKGFIEELQISQVDVSKFADAMYNLGQFLGMVTNKVTNLTGSLTDLKQWFIDFARGPLGMSKWLQKSVVDPIGTLKDSVSSLPTVAGGGSALEQYLKRLQKMQDANAAKASAQARKDEAQKKRQAALDKATAEKKLQYDTELAGLAAASARTNDSITKERLKDLAAIRIETMSSALGLTTMEQIMKMVNEQFELAIGKIKTATNEQAKWTEQMILSSQEAARLSALYMGATPGSAASARLADQLASSGVVSPSGAAPAPRDGQGTWTLPPTGSTNVNVTVTGSLLAQQDLEAAIAGAVNSAARAGLSYNQVFSRL